jgi:hypothetical protein
MGGAGVLQLTVLLPAEELTGTNAANCPREGQLALVTLMDGARGGSNGSILRSFNEAETSQHNIYMT